jgi:hypothetical protein
MDIKQWDLLIQKGKYPCLIQVVELYDDSSMMIEYDSDRKQSRTQFPLKDAHHVYQKYNTAIDTVVMYCRSARSRFCQWDKKTGYYLVTPEIVGYIGLELAGSSQEEFLRALKLKAFW